ncbi:MAG TPA: hypothetical protein PLO99_04105 [Chitinophagaceae bacterium]|nr:hypothetical protein [Chitinophagaceae bacterium]HRG91401.1 hypothetical protein [Chitinophagaceae bacterium]
MDYLLLDVVDVVPAREANGPGLGFYLLLGITILAEAALMRGLKYQQWGPALFQSLLANLASLAIGFLLLEWVPGLFFPNELLNLAALWLITVLIETPVLYLLNRQKILTSTIKVSLLINLLSYLLFYGYLQFFAR